MVEWWRVGEVLCNGGVVRWCGCCDSVGYSWLAAAITDCYYYSCCCCCCYRHPGGRKMFFRWARPLSSDPQLQQQLVRTLSTAEGALQRKQRISRKVLSSTTGTMRRNGTKVIGKHSIFFNAEDR